MISSKTYLSKSILLFIFGIILCHQLSVSRQTLEISYVHCALCFGVLIGITSYIFLKKPRAVIIFLTLFILKQIIGIIHYHYFIDPSYFTGSGDLPVSIWREQRAVFYAISRLSDMKDSGVIIPYLPENILSVSHPELMTFISLPLHYFGVHALNFLPLNSFFALLIAINFKLLAEYFKLDKKQTDFVFWMTVLFPVFLFDDHVWRDVVGVSLIVWSMTGYILSRKDTFYLRGMFLLLLIFTSYIHRTVYAFVALCAVCFDFINNVHSRQKRVLLLLICSIILIFCFRFIISFEEDDYILRFVNVKSFIMFPLKVVLGIIGPFPWFQISDYHSSPELGYQLGNYIMGVLLLGVLIYVCRYRIWRSRIPMNVLSAYSIGLLVASFIATSLDQNYVAEGFIFLVIWLAPQIQRRRFLRSLLFSLLFLFILNIIVSLIGNMGLKLLWS